jgi:hypothetical protein
MTTIRDYTRESGDHTENVHVTIDDNGYVRLTADNLHHVLDRLGFELTTKEPTT